MQLATLSRSAASCSVRRWPSGCAACSMPKYPGQRCRLRRCMLPTCQQLAIFLAVSTVCSTKTQVTAPVCHLQGLRSWFNRLPPTVQAVLVGSRIVLQVHLPFLLVYMYVNKRAVLLHFFQRIPKRVVLSLEIVVAISFIAHAMQVMRA